MILESDYTVRYAPFPSSIPALTAKDENGHYNIYINSFLSDDLQRQAVAHELAHLIHEDFDPRKPLECVEPYRRC